MTRCHHAHGDPGCSCGDDFVDALEGWLDSLTPAERREYAAGLGVDPDDDAEFEQAMSDMYAEHLSGDSFEREAFPPPPRVAKPAPVHPIFARMFDDMRAVGLLPEKEKVA